MSTKNNTQPKETGKVIELPEADKLLQQIKAQQEKLARLNVMFDHRQKFIQLQEDLKRYRSNVSEAVASGEFEQTKHKLVFTENGQYRDDALFNIGQPDLLIEFCEWIGLKVSSKIQELNSNIIAASN